MKAASITNPQSLNLYGYCGNDPINRLDPQGLFFGAIIAAIVAVIGAIAGAIVAVAQVIWIYVLVPTINFIGGAMLTLFEAAPWLKPLLIPHFAEAGAAAAWKSIAFYSALAGVGAVRNFVQGDRKQAEDRLEIAYNAALVALRNPLCAAIIKGKASSNPKDLLQTLKRNNQIVLGEGKGKAVTATKNNDDLSGFAKGKQAKLIFRPSTLNNDNLSGDWEAGIGAERGRAVRVLHELAHATGSLTEDHGIFHGKTVDNSKMASASSVNDEINKVCFGGGK